MGEAAEVLRINRLTAEFFYPETERGFREDIRARRIRDTRLAILLAAVFYLVFASTDYLAMGVCENYSVVLATRASICAAGLITAFLLPKYWRQLVNGVIPGLVAVFAMAGFIAITFLRPYSVGWHGMSMMIMLLGGYVFIPNRFLAILSICLTGSLIFLLLAAIHFGLPGDELLRLSTLLIVTNIMGAMANYRLSWLMREEYRDRAIVEMANLKLQAEMVERARLEEVLRQRAETDDVTGALDRGAFFVRAEMILRQADVDLKPLAVLFIDVDYFKQINVTYGHIRSDQVLKILVQVCNSLLREPYCLARLGGEEFVVLLPGLDLAGGAKLAEQIRAECQRTPVAMDEVDVHFTVSIGVVQRQSGEPARVALMRADTAMASAKFKGRNRVEAVN
ncbi:MAG: hypothetical protein COS39_07125 [Hydrogenophilales bacterium CG03_land_8_20_14_0_80_62_28]|nr:diguanylate cyclase [Betaproteobacteria bacterium]OIO77145.1 MAG: hypothetical protein AUJ86_09390 [Hydrogenophilaceae bacterium CG1_02_62_390]PIV22530.1 MAG: hypothetical protein COS39_07125 [Hydrogenophilales bacterium CG03_land_8_20_14_0_80_62_28]PIW38309.1 MAG: hypothetical protein COW23_07225 [Hydrogenophilales bacterium CG15_BIG_FIL_POST_REV_8_21_14_020_62_31]PIW72178.1 MAG: hypothetical protein COW07_04430 [Hydrogenophilales bacterium CG12_big_fil_rev_8_21_14_0_65_61_21]PIX02327.1 MA